MKKIITLIICMILSVMTVNADICFAGGEPIKIEEETYCLNVINTDIYSASYEDNVFYITLSEKVLKEANQIKEIEKTVDGRTFKVDDINIDLEVNMYIVGDQSFVVGPNGEDVIWEETIDPAIGVFNEKIKITDYTNIYNSKKTYIVYEDKNCINKDVQGNERYANCNIGLETKPKFVVNILRDDYYDTNNCQDKDDFLVEPTNPDVEENCEQTKCAEPLTFIEYLQNDNILLGVIIIVPTILLVTIGIIIVKYKKLKKNINK